MKITKQDATEIVNELSELIGMKINVVGSDSIIIANSDPRRVGDYHEATSHIIANHLNELVVYNDQQYKGTNAGTNVPLIIDGEIVGVIGITGPHQIAKTYGKIIQRMAEIMLRSRAEEDRKLRQRQMIERYCDSWVTGSRSALDDEFIQRGQSLGIDVTVPRRIMMLSSLKADNEKVYNFVRKQVGGINSNNYVFLTTYVVLVLEDRLDPGMSALANQLVADLKEQGCTVYAGIDDGSDTFLNINQQYEHAKVALSAGLRLRNNPILFYQDLSMELMLDEISVKSKLRFIKKVFRGCTLEEIKRDMHTVSVLYDEDGSIKKAAERLIMHPNTLQYQLKRIEDKTGFDPRKLRHAEIFGIANLFLEELGDQLQEDERFSSQKYPR